MEIPEASREEFYLMSYDLSMRKPQVGKPRVRAKTSSLTQRIPTVGRPKTQPPKTLTRPKAHFNKPWK